MKDGDQVEVIFFGDKTMTKGVIVDHTADWRNVTIRLDTGGTMNGPVATIRQTTDYARVYPEAKGIRPEDA